MLTRIIYTTLIILMPSVIFAKDITPVIDLHHWWKTPAEQAAVNVIKKAAEQRNAIFEQYALENFYSHRSAVIERVGLGYLPAVTQWLAGEDLLALNKQGLLRNMPATVGGEDLRKVLYPQVIQEVGNDEMLLALPVGLHIQNIAFYSAKIYQELNLVVPSDWQTFLEQAETIQAAGYTPIALSDNSWFLSFLVDSYIVSQGGQEAIKAIRFGEGDVKRWRELLVELFEFLRKVKPYTNAQWKNLSWNENAKLVAQGKAAMQVIGDFAEAVMVHHGYVSGEDYFYDMTPGNNRTMIYGADVFALLKVDDAERQAGQDTIVETVLAPKVQKNYVSKKGGIPVRKDVDISDLGESRSKVFEKWLDVDVEKIKLPESNQRFHYKVLETLTFDFWRNPDKYLSEEMVQKFFNAVEPTE